MCGKISHDLGIVKLAVIGFDQISGFKEKRGVARHFFAARYYKYFRSGRCRWTLICTQKIVNYLFAGYLYSLYYSVCGQDICFKIGNFP